MGVVANVKQYIAQKAVSTAHKIGDGITIISSLSPKQIQEVEEKRQAFLSKRPDMTDDETQSQIKKNIGAIGIEVYQAYIEQLKDIYVPIYNSFNKFDEENRIRFFNITKWVTNTEEHSLDKLTNVYHVLSNEECNVALIYHRSKEDCKITIGVANTDEHKSDPATADKYYERIVDAIKGNFPGTEIDGLNSKEKDYGVGIPECLESICGNKVDNEIQSVAIVSNVASEKSEGFISQSMEKLLDGIIPENEDEEYTIVLLAKPLKNQLEAKNRLFELYTNLAPYAEWQTGFMFSDTNTIGSSANAGVNLGAGVGINASDSTGEQSGQSIGFNASANFGVSFSRASNVSISIGKNESLTQSFVNFGIKHTLEVIETQLKRIEESSALGMWDFAAYFISKSPVIANNTAYMYLALTQGDESYLSNTSVKFWDGDIETDAAKTILCNIQRLQHPVFGLKNSLEEDWLMYPVLVTPATLLSGKELAKAFNFPKKSVSGLPVLSLASFGREAHSLSNDKLDIAIGCGYHMMQCYYKQKIFISRDELTSHTFITGSTGSGKSNTIYKLIDELCLKGDKAVKFLVIEPAKGEYKDVFGGIEGVSVYGTNVQRSPLLKLNPFSFPDEIHVLEHIDRLIEIFNACWPMYAAMPAVLKDAVEEAYIDCGWNLTRSACAPMRYPTFADVLKKLPEIMNSSAYSADTKGDYSGALMTRLKSLTNGINGQILCADDEIPSEKLFDQNVIIDLSRIGSMETKALLMGILMIKLQEYRMAKADGQDTDLRHITILEEAHNLLRRTSMEQSQEGSNLQGKSVEMLTNAIAEMRTYGEGFVIADQAPGLLDPAVIRNTNTKIIMRLPDEGDRQLVGKAAGLNDDQIKELARLDKGVAAVYQSSWIEPVLCKIDKFEKKASPYKYTYDPHNDISPAMEKFFGYIVNGSPDISELCGEEVDQLRRWIDRQNTSQYIKSALYRFLSKDNNIDEKEKGKILYCVLNRKIGFESEYKKADTSIKFKDRIDTQIMAKLNVSEIIAEEIRKMVITYIMRGHENDPKYVMLAEYGGIR